MLISEIGKRTIFKIAPAHYRHTQVGLTLIELLIVMAILALATSVVIVNAPPLRNPARIAAEEFEIALRGTVDQAVITGGAYRLEVQDTEWRIARLSNAQWETVFNSNQETQDRGVLLSVDVQDAAKSNATLLYGSYQAEQDDRDAPTFIAIAPFGETPAFATVFQRDGVSWQVRHLEDGRVEIERL